MQTQFILLLHEEAVWSGSSLFATNILLIQPVITNIIFRMANCSTFLNIYRSSVKLFIQNVQHRCCAAPLIVRMQQSQTFSWTSTRAYPQTALAAHMHNAWSRWNPLSKSTLIAAHEWFNKGFEFKPGFSCINVCQFPIKAVILNTARCTRPRYRKVDNNSAKLVHTIYQRHNGHF